MFFIYAASFIRIWWPEKKNEEEEGEVRFQYIVFSPSPLFFCVHTVYIQKSRNKEYVSISLMRWICSTETAGLPICTLLSVLVAAYNVLHKMKI